MDRPTPLHRCRGRLSQCHVCFPRCTRLGRPDTHQRPKRDSEYHHRLAGIRRTPQSGRPDRPRDRANLRSRRPQVFDPFRRRHAHATSSHRTSPWRQRRQGRVRRAYHECVSTFQFYSSTSIHTFVPLLTPNQPHHTRPPLRMGLAPHFRTPPHPPAELYPPPSPPRGRILPPRYHLRSLHPSPRLGRFTREMARRARHVARLPLVLFRATPTPARVHLAIRLVSPNRQG